MASSSSSSLSRLHALLLALLVLCTTCFQPSDARPWRRGPPPPPSNSLSEYSPALSNGSATLPSPVSGLKLKAIALGRGTQNYTCNPSTPSAAPVAIGALATLFDATPLLPLLPPAAGQEVLNLLPAYLVCFPLSSLTSSSLPELGVHYFDASGVPTFDLGSLGLLKGEKVGDIAAPENSSKGPEDQGNGAVDWLALTPKPGDGTVGLGEVYRVETAGGEQPETCVGQPAMIEVQYAAQYWFYA